MEGWARGEMVGALYLKEKAVLELNNGAQKHFSQRVSRPLSRELK